MKKNTDSISRNRENRLSIIKAYDSLPPEGKGNVIVILFQFVTLLSVFACYLLSEFNIFKSNLENVYTIAASVYSLVLLILLFVIFKSKKNLLCDRKLKYILLVITFIWVSFIMVTNFYHATLLLATLILLSFCYYSRRFNLTMVAFSITMVIATPFLSYSLGLLEAGFPIWYINIINPDYLSELGMQFYEDTINTGYISQSVSLSMITWIILPRLIIIMTFYFLSLIGSKMQSRANDEQYEHIIAIQDAAIESMSEIIENRDALTGGHVKRTQDVVSELVKYARKEFPNTEDYWKNVAKSAAMHDFGKIAISDQILNKPAKLTPEEFCEIKKHPDKSVEIINTVLGKIEDEELLTVAKNIARFHHEKYDGSGYPLGLRGDNIPFEARIMAIADVFDALVSKRVYKDSYSYDRAYLEIITTMGSHFDPKLRHTFDQAYPQLCKMYSSYAS